MYKTKECEHCQGKGYIITHGQVYRFVRLKCGFCNGTGVNRTPIIDNYSHKTIPIGKP
jgi:excinuclease UvrABC ATPase subunit